MANPDFIKNYNAAADIPAYTLVKFGANDGEVVPATSSTDMIVGVNQHIDVKNGEPCDVIHEGSANVKLGGTVTRADFITADANGCGVKAAPAAGVNANVVGFALVSGVAGDVIPVKVEASRIQG